MNIQKITSTVQNFINGKLNFIKNVDIPAILLLCTSISRPGLSSLKSATNIITSLNKLGIPTGKGPDGSDNKIVEFVQQMCAENVRAITMDAVVQTSTNIGSIVITSMGANEAGPVMSTGINMGFIKSQGLLS